MVAEPQRQNTLRIVIDQGLRLARFSAVAGLIGALIVAQLMRSLLYGVGGGAALRIAHLAPELGRR